MKRVIVDPSPPVIAISTAEAPRPKYYIHGKQVTILAERIEYLDENGKPVTECVRDHSKKGTEEATRQGRRFPQALAERQAQAGDHRRTRRRAPAARSAD